MRRGLVQVPEGWEVIEGDGEGLSVERDRSRLVLHQGEGMTRKPRTTRSQSPKPRPTGYKRQIAPRSIAEIEQLANMLVTLSDVRAQCDEALGYDSMSGALVRLHIANEAVEVLGAPGQKIFGSGVSILTDGIFRRLITALDNKIRAVDKQIAVASQAVSKKPKRPKT